MEPRCLCHCSHAPAPDSLPEPPFALHGYAALPAPAEVCIDALRGKLVAHRFSVADWPPGWCVGIVTAQSTRKRTLWQYEVDYGRQFNPAVYLHELRADQYGPTRNWVLVEQQ